MPTAITPAMVGHLRNLAEPRLSPTGEAIAFVSAAMGRAAVMVMRLGPGWTPGPEVAVTTDPAPFAPHPYAGGSFDWTPDGTALVFAGRDGALYRVGIDGGAPTVLAEPAGRGGGWSAPAVSPEGQWVAAIAENADASAIAVLPATAGGSWPVRVSDPAAADFVMDPAWGSGGRVVWHQWQVPAMPWDASEIVRARLDLASGIRINVPARVGGGPDVSVGQPRYSPDGSRLGFITDERGFANVGVDGAVHEEPYEHADPTWGPGQRTWCFSPDGAAVAYRRNEAGFGRLVVSGAEADRNEMAKGQHLGLSWVRRADGTERLAAVRSGATTPTQVVLYDPARGADSRVVVARGPAGGFEASPGLVEPEVLHWRADDGATVHGRLYRAPSAATPPLLVMVHGGPTSQTPVAFTPRIAYWVERGWSVLVPDHRGSTGWGRAYAQAMRERWGDLDVADTASGIRHVIDAGGADPRRVAITGGSAGGFTVLGVLARHPELCAAGVDLFGVADLLDLDETTHRYEKHYLHSIVGPLPGTADRYRERSPVHLAERITAPLLILQGEDDKVVPPAQSRAIAATLTRLGRTVETHFYPGEGHGWGRPETIIDELTRTEDFLRRHVLRWR